MHTNWQTLVSILLLPSTLLSPVSGARIPFRSPRYVDRRAPSTDVAVPAMKNLYQYVCPSDNANVKRQDEEIMVPTGQLLDVLNTIQTLETDLLSLINLLLGPSSSSNASAIQSNRTNVTSTQLHQSNLTTTQLHPSNITTAQSNVTQSARNNGTTTQPPTSTIALKAVEPSVDSAVLVRQAGDSTITTQMTTTFTPVVTVTITPAATPSSSVETVTTTRPSIDPTSVLPLTTLTADSFQDSTTNTQTGAGGVFLETTSTLDTLSSWSAASTLSVSSASSSTAAATTQTGVAGIFFETSSSSSSSSTSSTSLALLASTVSSSSASSTSMSAPTATVAPSDYVFDAQSSKNIAVYFGQTPVTGETTLEDQCADPDVDIVILAFVISATDGGIYPSVNFGAACGGQTSEMQEQAPGLLSCPELASYIDACQSTHGKKVLLSIGGATSGVSFASPEAATAFADVLWDLFGPTGNVDDGLRPFGNVTIDGFDVDNENNMPANYEVLGSTLRSHYANDTSKDYYLTSAPQCPFPDASNPSALLLQCDFVFVQFYNNPQCEIGSTGFNASVSTWSTALEASTRDVKPKLYIGAPAFVQAGASAYTKIGTAEGMMSIASEVAAMDVPNLGGIMFWPFLTDS